jgi:hypothetical protein
MKRRTLDILLSIGGVAAACLLAVLGLVMTSNANFSQSYVHNQLVQEKVSFPPLSAMTAEEKAAPCVVANAGKLLQTGKQAECYANSYIGLHVKSVANGQTYAELGTTQFALKAQITAAAAAKDPSVPALTAKLADVTAQRETLFKGETLRGLLLTSYGFSVMGVKAGQAAAVAYAGAGLLAVLTIAGFAHGLHTKKTEAFAPVDSRGRINHGTREMAHA